MSTIVLLEPSTPGLRKTLESWDHQIVPMLQQQVLDGLPALTADLLLVDKADEQLEFVEQLRQIETTARAPFPKLGVGWKQADRWPAYEAGLDACLDNDQTLLRALLPCPQIWAGHAFDPQFALKTMGHSSIVEQMVEVFLAETPQQFKQLQAVYLEGDNARLARAAHRFAGGLAMWGQVPALRATLALKHAAKNNLPTDPMFQVLKQTLERLLETLAHLWDIRALGPTV